MSVSIVGDGSQINLNMLSARMQLQQHQEFHEDSCVILSSSSFIDWILTFGDSVAPRANTFSFEAETTGRDADYCCGTNQPRQVQKGPHEVYIGMYMRSTYMYIDIYISQTYLQHIYIL